MTGKKDPAKFISVRSTASERRWQRKRSKVQKEVQSLPKKCFWLFLEVLLRWMDDWQFCEALLQGCAVRCKVSSLY